MNIQDGTSARTVHAAPGPNRSSNDVSFEIGACFLPVRSSLIGLNDAEIQVLAWLRSNQLLIAKAERRFRVDRRAIAGAIAWEMLENVHSKSARAVGPGKVHLFNVSKRRLAAGLATLPIGFLLLASAFNFEPLAKEVEERGYLPSRSYGERKALLATTEGAILYIGAIMDAIADCATNVGFEDLRSNPVILTNVYQSRTLKTWEEHLQAKEPGSPFKGGNTMDKWVSTHLLYLEDGVGRPDLPALDPGSILNLIKPPQPSMTPIPTTKGTGQ